MNFFSAITDYLDKARSRIYGIFAFWLILFHAPLIFSALFLDQDLIYKADGILKDQFLAEKYFTGMWWMRELGVVVLSAILTWLMIWVLPKTLIAKAYDEELLNQFNLESKKIANDKRLEQKRQNLADEQLTTIEKRKDLIKEEADVEEAEQDSWGKEYARFKRNGLVPRLNAISEVIYSYKGHIGKYWDDDYGTARKPAVTEADIAVAHTNGLIELDTETNTISLTDKGKFFLSQSYEKG